MDDLCPAVSQLDGVQVVQFRDLHRIGENLRVGIQDAVHIFPYRHGFRVEDIGRHRCRVIRTFASQGSGRAVRSTSDKALPDENTGLRLFHGVAQQSPRCGDIDRGVLVSLFGAEATSHIEPAIVDTPFGEVLRNDRRRDQLAESDDGVVPQLGVFRTIDRFGRHLFELPEKPFDLLEPGRSAVQFVYDFGVVLPQRGDVLPREGFVALLQPFENLLQGIRGLTHCRYDDEQIPFVTDDLQQVLHTVRVADRCAAELVNFHRSIKQYGYRPVLRRAGFRTRIGIGPAASETPFSTKFRTCDRNSIISFRPSCKACPYSRTGTRTRR